MKFRFDLSRCAYGNSPEAIIRECTRLACIAWCLKHLGHTVCVPGSLVPTPMLQSQRYKREPFRSLPTDDCPGALTVCSEHTPGDVIIKTSVSCERDSETIKNCRLLVAHEYHPDVADDERLLPVPFLCHDRILEFFTQAEALTAYLRNDVEMIRSIYRKPQGTIGFIGNGGYGRKDMLRKFEASCADRKCDFKTYDTMPLDARDYLRRIGGYDLGLLLPGSTPKSNRHAELALLGIPIVTVERTVRDTPDLTHENCIHLEDWSDAVNYNGGLDHLAEIQQNADAAYANGWSPLAQSKLIAERLG